MIDDDDNYYDVSNEEFTRIRNTGKPIYPAPVFMQKVKMPPTNPNFIQIGMVSYRKTNEVKGLFARRTKELEQGQKQTLENFSKAIAPYIYETFLMCEQAKENMEQFIADKTTEKEKKIEKVKRKCQREIEKIEDEYNRKIEQIKSLIQNMKDNKET